MFKLGIIAYRFVELPSFIGLLYFGMELHFSNSCTIGLYTIYSSHVKYDQLLEDEEISLSPPPSPPPLFSPLCAEEKTPKKVTFVNWGTSCSNCLLDLVKNF